jgi:hypothetical protein
MKQLKLGILGAGLVGLIAIFLPYISAGGQSMKFWDFRQMPSGFASGLLNGPKQVYIALIGFLAAGAVAGLAVATKRLARWQAIVGLVGFLLALATEGVRKGLSGAEGIGTAIGGKLLFLAAIAGIVVSIVGIAKPEKAA